MNRFQTANRVAPHPFKEGNSVYFARLEGSDPFLVRQPGDWHQLRKPMPHKQEESYHYYRAGSSSHGLPYVKSHSRSRDFQEHSYRRHKDQLNSSIYKSRDKLSQTQTGWGKDSSYRSKTRAGVSDYLFSSTAGSGFYKGTESSRSIRVNSSRKIVSKDRVVLGQTNRVFYKGKVSPQKDVQSYKKQAPSPSKNSQNNDSKKVVQKLLRKYEPAKIYSPKPMRQQKAPYSQKKETPPVKLRANSRSKLQSNLSKPMSNDLMPSGRQQQQPPLQRSSLTVDDFLRLKLLGGGKFGKVHLVVQKKSGCMFALKSIKKAMVKQYDMQQQLVREIKIQSYLDHPNIGKLYSFFDDEQFVYLLEELGERGQLYKILRAVDHFSEEEAANYIGQVLSALLYMHERRILHRDLKPENIVLQGDTIKLVDFGWAVVLEADNRTTFCGTPEYVSPEIVKGQSYNECSDSWSLGVLTFELLFGKSPFSVENEKELGKIKQLVMPPEIEVSEEAKDFMRRLLDKDKYSRMTTREAAQHKWLRRR